MTPEEAVEVIRHQHHAVMATTRSDGGVQLSPVAVIVDDDGTLVVSSRETAMKTHNIRRHPYAAVCVFPDSFFGGRWVQAEGPARVDPLPGAIEGLVSYYRNLVGEHPDWDEYRAAMVTEKRVLLRITVERAGPSKMG